MASNINKKRRRCSIATIWFTRTTRPRWFFVIFVEEMHNAHTLTRSHEINKCKSMCTYIMCTIVISWARLRILFYFFHCNEVPKPICNWAYVLSSIENKWYFGVNLIFSFVCVRTHEKNRAQNNTYFQNSFFAPS